jgi:hypothetical protein
LFSAAAGINIVVIVTGAATARRRQCINIVNMEMEQNSLSM